MKKILFVAALAAMSVTTFAKKQDVRPMNFSGQTLHLVEINGEKYSAESTMRPVQMVFANDKVHCQTGCNTANAGFTLNGDTIRFSQPMSTMMACDEVSNKMERSILDLMQNTNRYSVSDKLVSFYHDNDLLGVFTMAARNANKEMSNDNPVNIKENGLKGNNSVDKKDTKNDKKDKGSNSVGKTPSKDKDNANNKMTRKDDGDDDTSSDKVDKKSDKDKQQKADKNDKKKKKDKKDKKDKHNNRDNEHNNRNHDKHNHQHHNHD